MLIHTYIHTITHPYIYQQHTHTTDPAITYPSKKTEENNNSAATSTTYTTTSPTTSLKRHSTATTWAWKRPQGYLRPPIPVSLPQSHYTYHNNLHYY
jgi:hypothetical protein